MAGAEKAVSEALALLMARDRGQEAGYRMIALSDAAEYMAEPWKVGFTTPDAIVGGALPEYNLYETSDGWLAVAALEPHFRKALFEALDCNPKDADDLRPLFKERSSAAWEEWAKERDLPLEAVKTS
jgi:alpha-methylacyl-CoA racemase